MKKKYTVEISFGVATTMGDVEAESEDDASQKVIDLMLDKLPRQLKVFDIETAAQEAKQ